MWVERIPETGDTVKIEFADWTKLGTQIGIAMAPSFNGIAVQFGRVVRYFDRHGTFFVWEK